MKLKYKFELVNLGEEIISVPVGEGAEQVHGILKLNESGREILSLLEKETTEEQIVDVLAAKYDNERKDLSAYVRTVLEKLSSAGLLDE